MQFLLDSGIGLVVFGTDYALNNSTSEFQIKVNKVKVFSN
jgi:hypothetical protein